MGSSSKDSSSRNPKEEAGFFSLLLISWMDDLLRIGYARPLKDDDLHELSRDFDAEEITEQMADAWEDELTDARRKQREQRLWRAVLKLFPWQQYIFILALKYTGVAMQLVLPILLWFYLKILKDGSQGPEWYSILCAAGISVSVLMRVLAGKHTDLQTKTMAIKLKVALIGIIQKKVLQVQRHILYEVNAGQIQNLISSDVQRMEKLYLVLAYFITTPLILVTSLILLWLFIVWQALSGTIVLLILGALFLGIAKKYATLRTKQAKLTDQRLGFLNEVISGIRAVKIYGWEQSFMKLIQVVRRKEIGFVTRKAIFQWLNASMDSTINDITTLISIVVLIKSGIQLFSYDIFTLAMVMELLKYSVTYNMDYCYRYLQEAKVSLERIENFLCKPDLQQELDDHKAIMEYDELRGSDSIQPSLILTSVSAAWRTNQKDVIHNVTLQASPRQLVMITGPVGSGKSSLLMAMQGEIPITSGSISSYGKIAYVSQIPWTFSGTVRDNIVFGKRLNESRYQRVLDLCDLQKDLDRFPKGDLSIIGQRGILLSGGQRSRVSLARAMYSQADIILLDDPLSAVDARVGQHIFEKCICEDLSDSLRILVTHQLQYLHRADWIVLVKEGHIEAQGSYEELDARGMIQKVDTMEDVASKSDDGDRAAFTRKSKREEHELDSCCEVRDLLEEDEEKAVGHVTWRLYWSFLRAGSNFACLLSYALFYVMVQAMVLSPSILQTYLANMSYTTQESSRTLGLYVALICLLFCLVNLRNFLCYHIIISSSKHLHGRMTEAVIKSPVLFFDTNPIGRIMNRFSRDIGILDDELPLRFECTLTTGMKCVGAVVLAVVVNQWFLLVIIPLFIFSYFVARHYLKTSRELSRMVSIRYSPVYAHVSETIRGLEVIRTSRMEGDFVTKLIRLQNQHTKAFYLLVALNQWVALRIDLICAGLVIAVAFVGVFAIKNEALTGMLLTVTMSLVSDVEFGLRMACDIENNMTSVERVMTYCSLPSEPGYSRPQMTTKNWPEKGMLTLKDVSLQYVEDGVRVLSDINLLIQPKEKIGIVGRTGAGKSSLVAAILRMPEPQGQVLIDGVDLGTIDIQAARTSMAVISQDPVLFAGSLRRTLDPFDRFTDQQIWTALGEVQLSEMVSKIPGQLDYCIGEFGTGFSVGERQLLCLARALMERRQVMIMDEATANVDYKTDQLIQHVIRHKFRNCTVMTIAHRINTVMDYDKIVVMDQGHVIEYDTPAVLAGKRDSKFYELWQNQTMMQ